MKFLLLLCTLLHLPLVAYELSIAALFQDEAPYLKEWIEYHRMVGAQHFWLYNDKSHDDWQYVLKPYIDEGLVELIDWSGEESSFRSERQVSAYKDALSRAKGKSSWLALIDVDEFLLPKFDRTVTDCLSKHFRLAAGVYVSARQFGTGGVTLAEGEPILCRLTSCSIRTDPRNCPGKSIVRTDTVLIDETWHPRFCMLAHEANYFNSDGEVMQYVGGNLQLNGLNHDDWICINHYPFRDESYFQKMQNGSEKIWDDYFSNNFEEDSRIIQFIRERHPEMYEQFWKEPSEVEKKPFVTIQVSGGLGNILFQVATACALAWDNRAEPVFTNLSIGSALLSRCKERNISNDEIESIWPEFTYAYAPIPYRPNMLLRGYFHSEQYFAHQRARLLELFAPRPKDLAFLREKYGWILDHPEAVGVQLRHFPQGYPHDKIYPQYGRDYLEKAAAFFPESALFVISSNNIDFAKQNIPTGMKNIAFIECESAETNLFLLSLCKHNIITNSSFGWWSAWLNQNPNKIVVRPSRWMNFPCPDFCPQEWVNLEANYD